MKLTIDHTSTIPLYAQAEELLRKLIVLPEYQEGKFLPNEVDMSKELGISRNTLRQATNKLVYEGLLHRKKGVGTGMVRMNMRVDQDLDGAVGKRPNCRQCLLGNLSVLGVHQQDAIRSKQHHGPAAGRIGVCPVKAARTVQSNEIR